MAVILLAKIQTGHLQSVTCKHYCFCQHTLCATHISIKHFKSYLFTLKISPHHTTCSDQCGHHQVFKIDVEGLCCACVFVVSGFSM
jgi:hypothetical protein